MLLWFESSHIKKNELLNFTQNNNIKKNELFHATQSNKLDKSLKIKDQISKFDKETNSRNSRRLDYYIDDKYFSIENISVKYVLLNEDFTIVHCQIAQIY